MRRLAELITRDAGDLAAIETRDTGKLLREMRGQLGSIPDWFYYFMHRPAITRWYYRFLACGRATPRAGGCRLGGAGWCRPGDPRAQP
jgi:acyl-CoA reductase-like NAD-dependent aldehyde dehydrogenase